MCYSYQIECSVLNLSRDVIDCRETGCLFHLIGAEYLKDHVLDGSSLAGGTTKIIWLPDLKSITFF